MLSSSLTNHMPQSVLLLAAHSFQLTLDHMSNQGDSLGQRQTVTVKQLLHLNCFWNFDQIISQGTSQGFHHEFEVLENFSPLNIMKHNADVSGSIGRSFDLCLLQMDQVQGLDCHEQMRCEQ